MKLDFLIPGSPNDGFFSQIAFFRLALDSLGGAYRDARLVAVFGHETPMSLPSQWAPYFKNIDVHWADPSEVRRRDSAAQADKRFELFRPDADLVVLCDADTVIMRSFSGVASWLARKPALAGVIAHSRFPWTQSTGDSRQDWRAIAMAILGREIPCNHRYTLQGRPDAVDRCPFYINYGFFAGPPALMCRFYPRYREIRTKVVELLCNEFSGQVSLSLAVCALDLPTVALPMRFNFPNDPLADARYSRDMERIVMLHYLRLTHFNRQKIFTSAEEMRMFLSLNLQGSNRKFQSFVRNLTGGDYPFERPAHKYR